MKILHLLAQHPSKTGSGTSFRKIIEYMAPCHDQFALYGLNSDQSEEDVGCDSRAVIFSIDADGQHLFGMSDAMPYPTNTYDSMTNAQYTLWKKRWCDAITDAIADFAPDIIVSHHLYLLTALAIGTADVPVVGVCHGTDLEQLEKNDHHRALVQTQMPKIAAVFTNGPAQDAPLEELLHIPKEKRHVFGGGYDANFFAPPKARPKAPPVQLVYTGKISEHKGIRPLFHALSRVQQDIPIHLTIVGSTSGDEAEDLMALGEALNLPITYTGHLDQQDMGELYKQMHLFVLPSYAEGLSLVVLEALGAGLYVVATDIENLMAFLPENILESGQIQFVKRPSHTVLTEDDSQFENLITQFEELIVIQCTKVLELMEQSYIIDTKTLRWSSCVNRMEEVLLAIVQEENERRF